VKTLYFFLLLGITFTAHNQQILPVGQQEADLNKPYVKALKKIAKADKKERKKKKIDWNIQNRLDSLNRIELDRLYERYGFPSRARVGARGFVRAFLVLHHSTDCEWNERWIARFLEHYSANNLNGIFSFCLYRNYNQETGFCKDQAGYLEGLKMKHPEVLSELLDFEKWRME